MNALLSRFVGGAGLSAGAFARLFEFDGPKYAGFVRRWRRPAASAVTTNNKHNFATWNALNDGRIDIGGLGLRPRFDTIIATIAERTFYIVVCNPVLVPAQEKFVERFLLRTKKKEDTALYQGRSVH